MGSGGGSSRRIAESVSTGESPRGQAPREHLQSPPREKKSERRQRPPATCSGLMYPTVPAMIPARSGARWGGFLVREGARPSSALRSPVRSRGFAASRPGRGRVFRLDGRVTNPFAWRAARPSAIWAATRRLPGGNGRWRAGERSVSPRRTPHRVRTPSCSPTSKRGTTLGCERDATARASFSNRRTLSASAVSAPGRILIATRRWRRVSSAR